MKSENNYERIVQNSKKFQHSQKNEMQKRITDLLQQLTNGIHERDQIMAVSLLGAIAGHNTFLFEIMFCIIKTNVFNHFS